MTSRLRLPLACLLLLQLVSAPPSARCGAAAGPQTDGEPAATYARGLEAAVRGEWQAALAAFDGLVRAGAMVPYARFHRGRARLAVGDVRGGAEDLAAVARDQAPAALQRHARLRLAEARLRLGRTAEAAAGLRAEVARPEYYPLVVDTALARAPERGDLAEAWWLLASALRGPDRRAAARAAMVAGWGFPEQARAPQARRAATAWLGRPPRPADLPAEAYLARAVWLWGRGSFAEARTAIVRAVRRPPRAPAAAAQAWFVWGVLHLGADPRAAAGAIARAVVLAGRLGMDPGTAPYWQARALLRSGDEAGAAQVAEGLQRRDARQAARIALDLALVAERRGDFTRAERWLHVAVQAREGPNVEEARWRLGWVAWRAGRREAARARWVQAAQTEPRVARAAAALYWAARTTPDRSERIRLLRTAAQSPPWSLYAALARERLGLGTTLVPPGALPDSSAGPPAGRAGRAALARALLEARAYGEAAEAAAWAGDRATETTALHAAGRHPEAIRIAEELLLDEPAALHLAYPRPYAQAVVQEARRAGVPEALLFALVREESRFDAQAVSPAGAVGLTQVLPGTAAGLAGRPLPVGELVRPAVNLRLGAAYLARQLRRFRGNEVLALVAYNAGPGTAARWARTLPLDDLPAALETIPIRETRGYVYRVLQSRRIYAALGR